jgi:thiamine-phosphate pyrophosphorylase
MGGIKEHHLPELVSKGVRHIAMVTEITQAANVKEKVEHLRKYFQKGVL